MSSSNQIWISIDNDDGSIKEGFQFPYNPEEYQLTEGTNEKYVTVAGLGQIVVKSGISPMTLTFASFFSPAAESGLELEKVGDLKTPREYDSLIRKWKNGSKPVHLLITNTNINAYFSISTYTTSEEGGDVGKINFTISLKQYGSGSGDEGNGNGGGIVGGSNGSLVRRIDVDPYKCPTVPDTYIVQKKDTLQSIAKHFYGDSQMAYEIYKLNTEMLKKGVNTKLKVKSVLYMPHPAS